MLRFAVLIVTAALPVAGIGSLPRACGQSAWCERFEGPEPTWRDAGGDTRYRIENHRREQGRAHTGKRCERLSLHVGHGSRVCISHPLDRPRVIDELTPTVWVKSDRSGLQLLARVVLPRTADPRSGEGVSTLVGGTSYTAVGNWQQLRIDDIPRLLARRVRTLRTELGPNVDPREAYLDAVLLNIYGGPGVGNVWIDDLEVSGFVAGGQAGPAQGRVGEGDSPIFAAGNSGQSPSRSLAAPEQPPVPRLVGSVLTAAGRAVFPRIIQHQGEPLAFLQQLGFNTVWLSQMPTAEQLVEAERLGLWLVCPPPQPAGEPSPDHPGTQPVTVGSRYGCVLAWNLGWGLRAEQLDATRRWAEQVRSADGHRGRPLICVAQQDLRGYSRHVDVLLIDRRPIGTSLALADWGTWIRGRSLLARPGTPIWSTIQTQPTAALRRQLAALEPAATPPLALPSEQIRLQVHTAIAAGSRGLLCISQSPLDAADAQTRHRAMTLQLLNLEIRPIEPWAAAGSFQAHADSNRPELLATVLRSDRARVLIPVWTDEGAQYVPGQSAANDLSLVLPGVPDSSAAYQLLPGRLKPLRHKRVTGGMRVTFEEFGLTGSVLLAQDPLIVTALTRQMAAIGPRAAQLQRNLAVRKLHTVGRVIESLGGQDLPQTRQRLAETRKELQRTDGFLAAKDYAAAYLHARRAMRSLRLLERARWESVVGRLDSPLSIPPAAGFDTLPWYRGWTQRIRAARPAPNQLAGGQLEDIQTLLAAGWQHRRQAPSGVQTSADLVAAAAYSGGSGLRLTAVANDPEKPPAALETPPVWITTPPVAVRAGQIVCIRGWVQVRGEIAASPDGLMIVDSLGGEPLALCIKQTNGWRQFTIYRAAAEPDSMTVSFLLTGLGEVWLDDVVVQPLP